MGLSKSRMATAADLPPAAPHHQVVKMRQRALVVARNSKRGLWSRLATAHKKETLVTYASRYRSHPEWQGYGRLEVAYRPMPSGTKTALWVRFVAPESEKFTARMDAEVADLGHLAWEEGDAEDPGDEVTEGLPAD
jgi:hypothetical protein